MARVGIIDHGMAIITIRDQSPMVLVFTGILIRVGALRLVLVLVGLAGDFILIIDLIGVREDIIQATGMDTTMDIIGVMLQAIEQVIVLPKDLVFITIKKELELLIIKIIEVRSRQGHPPLIGLGQKQDLVRGLIMS